MSEGILHIVVAGGALWAIAERDGSARLGHVGTTTGHITVADLGAEPFLPSGLIRGPRHVAVEGGTETPGVLNLDAMSGTIEGSVPIMGDQASTPSGVPRSL